MARKVTHKKVTLDGNGYSPSQLRQLLFLCLPLSLLKISKRLNMSYSGLKKSKRTFLKDGLLDRNRGLTLKGKKVLEMALVGYDGVALFGDKQISDTISRIIREKQIRFFCEIKFGIDQDNDPSLKAETGGSFAVFRTWEIKNVRFKETIIDKVRVRRTTKSVIFIPPDIYDSDIMAAKNRALMYCDEVMPKVETWFNIRLGKFNKINMTFSKQHISLVNNQIAKWFIKHKQKLVIEDLQDGRARIIVDASKGFPELEAIHPLYAEEDAERLKAMTEDFGLGHVPRPQEQYAMLLGLTNEFKDYQKRRPALPRWLYDRNL